MAADYLERITALEKDVKFVVHELEETKNFLSEQVTILKKRQYELVRLVTQIKYAAYGVIAMLFISQMGLENTIKALLKL